jgi:hypothetical protein
MQRDVLHPHLGEHRYRRGGELAGQLQERRQTLLAHVVHRADEGDRRSAAEDPARLAVPRQKQGTGQQHAGEDRQPTQARRGALVEAALPGKVDRSDAVGELLGKGCEHQCHRARDQERPERLEVVHPLAL